MSKTESGALLAPILNASPVISYRTDLVSHRGRPYSISQLQDLDARRDVFDLSRNQH